MQAAVAAGARVSLRVTLQRSNYRELPAFVALARRLGRERVRVIAEAFRPKAGGGFRPATLEELRPQLATYGGFPIYLFEGPRYVPADVVEAGDVTAHRPRTTTPSRA